VLSETLVPAPLVLLVFVRLNMYSATTQILRSSPADLSIYMRAPHDSTFFDKHCTSRRVIAKVDASHFPQWLREGRLVVVTGSCGSCNNHFLTIIFRTFFVSSEAQHGRQAYMIQFWHLHQQLIIFWLATTYLLMSFYPVLAFAARTDAWFGWNGNGILLVVFCFYEIHKL